MPVEHNSAIKTAFIEKNLNGNLKFYIPVIVDFHFGRKAGYKQLFLCQLMKVKDISETGFQSAEVMSCMHNTTNRYEAYYLSNQLAAGGGV